MVFNATFNTISYIKRPVFVKIQDEFREHI